MRNDEFYIGWMDQSPSGFVSFLRKYLLLLIFIVIGLGVLLATNQKQFRDGVFEYGKLTGIQGTYMAGPVPHLLVEQDGGSMFVPLVGYGKQGAEGIMKEVEAKRGTSLNGKKVRLQGTLIQGEGKTLLQLDRGEDVLLEVGREDKRTSGLKPLGEAQLTGEVVDPKCYFGVMKPGEGKVHKDCAIRCIAGGIPPVLMMTDDKGRRSFVLLVGANGERLNEVVRDFVAVPSQVSGELAQEGNWQILRVKDIKSSFGSYTAIQSVSSACTMNCCSK